MPPPRKNTELKPEPILFSYFPIKNIREDSKQDQIIKKW